MVKRSISAILVILILITFLSGCSGNTGQDIDTILESELLQSHGILIAQPDSPYYRFLDRDDLQVGITLRVQGEYGTYYFEADGWTDELIAELVLVSEDGFRFVQDFLGIHVSEPLSIVFNVTRPSADHPLSAWNGGFVLGTSTYISMPARDFPRLIVHEIVHAVLGYAERRSNFPFIPEDSDWVHAMFLEEGLCDVVDFLFSLETEHTYRTDFDREGSLHPAALRELDRQNNFADEMKFGTRYPQLMSYQTAASFVYFLLEHHGSIEEFMRVFDDIYLMEEVFGQSMEDMIIEWLAYLKTLR